MNLLNKFGHCCVVKSVVMVLYNKACSLDSLGVRLRVICKCDLVLCETVS